MDKSFKLEQLLMPGVIERLIETSVWSATPVAEQPEIDLQGWQVRQLPNGDRYFVGWNATEREGRVNSKIVEFDAIAHQWRSASGRTYRLRGRSGRNRDGSHVWGNRARVNGIGEFEDISQAVQVLVDAAQLRTLPQERSE